VSLHRADLIASYNPKTKVWTEYPLPQAETDVRRIEVDKSNPNRIWFSSAGGTTAGTTGGDFNGGARMGFIEILN
jgi:streptogramin lyase